VVVVDGTYDDTVRRAAADAEKHGWQVVSDTAYPGYLEIPGWIMEGYTTIFEEAQAQLAEHQRRGPTAVILQAGVGGLACGGALYYWRHGPRPTLICAEPLDADCLRESIASPDGGIREAKGEQNSIMAGLNCGTPSLLAWPVIRGAMQGFLAIDDNYAKEAMRLFAAGTGGDPQVVSGESGAAGLGALLAFAEEPSLAKARTSLGLGPEARVLLVNTEGDTDPVSYRRIVGTQGSRT
jgi:diaminopropionate ammonia-lyase